MAYSAATYKGDGSQSTFIIPFDYLQKDFVKVTINEVDKVYAQDYNVDGRELSFPTAPPSGSIIKVYRETPTDRMVKWNEGSVLTSSNMTTQQIQELHLIEETTYNLNNSAMVKTEDNHKWEGQYLPITHVGDPTDDSDVVNLGTIKKEETGFLASVRSQLDKWLADLGTTYNSYSKSLKESFDSYASSLKNQFDTYTTSLLNDFNTYKDTLKTNYDYYASTLLSKYNEYLASLTATKDAVKDSFDSHTSSLKNQFDTHTASLLSDFNDYKDTLKTNYDNYTSTLLNNFNDYKTTLKNTYDTYTSNLSTTFNDYKTTLLSKYNEYLASLTTTKDAVKDSEANANKYKDEAKNFSDSAKDSATQCSASVATCTTRVTEANQAKDSASASANTASTKAIESGNSASLAKKWAVSSESPDGTVGSKSSKTWAEEAKSSEQKATISANNAKASENKAKASEGNAKASETASANSADASAKSATAAKDSENKAKTSAVNAKASEVAAAESAKHAAAGQINANWALTDPTSKAFIKNKPENLFNIGNYPPFRLNRIYKDDNRGNPIYFLMQELVGYDSNEVAPLSSNCGFNGFVFGYPRDGDGNNQYMTLVKVGLMYDYKNIFSSSTHYRPVVIKDEINNKYYWAMKINGSHQTVCMLGVFTTTPLNTAISAIDRSGSLPEGWSLIREARSYYLDNTYVSHANKDGKGHIIDTTYAKKSDLSTSLSTTSLTVTGETSVPTANEGNSSNTIASTEFVAKSLAKLVGSAPESLNTLNELAKALGDDPNFATTVLNELGKKMNEKDATDTFATKTEAENTYAKKGEAGVLSGTVTAFSGTFEDGYPIDKNTGLADKKWHLCDGTNGTPDLRNRFIYGGAGNNNGGTGGEVTHTLTINELPRFTPTAKISGQTGDDSNYMLHNNNSVIAAGTNQYASVVSSSPFNAIGNNQPHNNMPPYYVLAYIMKL